LKGGVGWKAVVMGVLLMRAGSKNAAYRSAAALKAEVYEVHVSMRGDVYVVKVDYGERDQATAIRQVVAHDPGAREVD
jgi:hypothetical protein